MSFCFRQAHRRDAEGIAAVQIATWRSTYQGIIDQSYLDTLNLEDRIVRWNENLQQPGMIHLVALDNEKIVGFCGAGSLQDSGSFEHLKIDPLTTGELYAIYIVKDYQRQGIGKEIFAHCRKWFKEKDKTQFITWALAANKDAIKFYETQGGTFLIQEMHPVSEKNYAEKCFIFNVKSNDC